MSGGRASRQKGDRIERDIVQAHRDIGIHAELVPQSGASRYEGNRSDIDVYAFGRESAPLCCEVKARASGEGFVTLDRWLGDNDALFLRRGRAESLIVLPQRVWERLIKAAAGVR